MTDYNKLLKQFSHYGVANIIGMAAGFISFPLFTRIFSVSDYGMLGLINTTLFIVVAFAKFGLPNSMVRFYEEFKSSDRLSTLYSTIFFCSTIIFFSIALIFFFVTKFIPDNLDEGKLIRVFPIISLLIFLSCIVDLFSSFLRAEQKTILYNSITTFRRYGSLVFSVIFVLFFIKGLLGFYIGQIISVIITLILLAIIIFRKNLIKFKKISPDLLKDSIKYGFPTIGTELGHLILNYADRYLVQLYLGAASLGLYTAGYNLTWYVTQLILHPLSYGITPFCMAIMVNEGEEKTKEFLTNITKYFCLIVMPITFGFIAISKDLIIFLASSKYHQAYTIIPYVIFGQMFYSSTIIINTGLYIKKKSYIVTIIMLICCILNIGFNILLIPKAGITGAALATLISYIFYAIIIIYFSFKEYSFRIDYAHILIYLLSSSMMYIAVSAINIESHLLNILVRIIAGVIIYSLLVLIFDPKLKQKILKIVSII